MDHLSRSRLPADQRRALIEQAAVRLFAMSGYAGTRLEDIAAAANVTKPILYRHFASKKALYLALLERHGQGQLQFVGPTTSETSFSARLPLLIDGWFASVEERPDIWRMIFSDTTGDADIQSARLRIQAGARTIIIGVLEAQSELSISSDELVPLAELFRSATVGLVLWKLDHPGVPRALLVDLVTRAIQGALDRHSATDDRVMA
jgi:AcrR family transcriptional regulator